MKLEVYRAQHHEHGKEPFSLTAKVTLSEEEQALLRRYPLAHDTDYLGGYPQIFKGETFYETNVYALHSREKDIRVSCQALADYLIAAQEYGGHEEYEFETFPTNT